MKQKILSLLRRYGLYALAGLIGVMSTRVACSPQTEPTPLGFAPLSAQGGVAVTSFAGVIDPTNPVWAGGLAACSSSCSSALLERNRAALQAAAAAAMSGNKTLYVPPGEYPLGRKSGQSYSIDLAGLNNLTIQAYGATFRQSGDATSTDYAMIWARNVTGLRVYGASFSQRDVTNATTNTVAILLGDGGSTLTDNTLLSDLRFKEGVGGDYIRLDGGASGTNVDRTTITLSFFEGSARAGVDVRPGARRLQLSYSFFKGNANRDLWFEAGGADNVIGQSVIVGDTFEHYTGTQESVTLDGNGGATVDDQTLFKLNKVFGGSLTAANVARLQIQSNSFLCDRAGSSVALVSLSGHVSDTWITENYFSRTQNATDGVAVRVSSDISPSNVLVARNRIHQYGTSNGIDLSGANGWTALSNDVSYHNTAADSGSTGFVGVYCAGSTTPCGGRVSQNRVKRDDQPITSTLDLHTLSLIPDVTTVVSARVSGTYGNTLQIRYLSDGATACGVNTNCRSEANGLISIHFKPATTTIATAEGLINGSSFVKVLTPSGSGSTLLQSTDAFAYTSLAGALQAGRMLAGVSILAGSGTTATATIFRDNATDGARAGVRCDLDGSSAWPDGYPLMSGNFLTNGVNEIEGGLTTWRLETTPQAETIASGALSLNKSVTFVSETGSQGFTLAAGYVDGFVHCLKVKSFTAGVGTLTPSPLADGITHTITWTAAGAAVCLVWDATGATYRVQSSTNVTIN